MALCDNKFHCLQLGRWRAPTRTSKRCGCAESMQRASERDFGGGQGDIGVQWWNSGPEVPAVYFTFFSVEESEFTRLCEDV